MKLKDLRLKLGDKEFQAYKLKHDGYRTVDIAKQMHITSDAAKKLLHRVKRKIGNDYQKCPFFRDSGYSALQPPNNWKKSERQILMEKLKNGHASMAYKKYVTGGDYEGYQEGEVRLAYAINGLGERDYLNKKRHETRKVLQASSRYTVIQIAGNQLALEAIRVLKKHSIPVIKSDFPLSDDESPSRYYLCKNPTEVERIFHAMIKPPAIRYEDDVLTLRFMKVVKVDCIRVIKHDTDEVLGIKMFNDSAMTYKMKILLEEGGQYRVGVQISNVDLSYLI